MQKDQKNNMRSLAALVLWPLILITYFLVSFSTGAWHVTWVLFIAGVMIQGIIGIVFEMRKGK